MTMTQSSVLHKHSMHEYVPYVNTLYTTCLSTTVQCKYGKRSTNANTSQTGKGQTVTTTRVIMQHQHAAHRGLVSSLYSRLGLRPTCVRCAQPQYRVRCWRTSAAQSRSRARQNHQYCVLQGQAPKTGREVRWGAEGWRGQGLSFRYTTACAHDVQYMYCRTLCDALLTASDIAGSKRSN